MLKLTWIEFFLRTIPEMVMLILGIHIITRKYFNISRGILAIIVSSIITFFVRWLPIYFGVHMIINIITIIVIMVRIEVPIIKSIYSTLLMYFILSLSEFINILLLKLLHIDANSKLVSPLIKSLYGIPSLIFLLIFIIIMNYLLKMKEGIKNVPN